MILRAIVAVLSTGVYTYGGLTVARQKTLAIKFARGAVAVYALTITAAMILRWHSPVSITVYLALIGSVLALVACALDWCSSRRGKGSQGTTRKSS